MSFETDTFLDVPKTVYKCLYGSKDLPQSYGSSDISFLVQMLQINTYKTNTSIHELSKQYDKYCFMDLTGHSFDGDTQWTLLEQSLKNAPTMKHDKWFPLDWPKSTAKSEHPSFTTTSFYEDAPNVEPKPGIPNKKKNI
jgi:hypothetical protein